MPAPTITADLDTVETTTTYTLRAARPIVPDVLDVAGAAAPFTPTLLEVYVCDDRDDDEPPYVEVTVRETAHRTSPRAAWTNDADHDHGRELVELPPWLRVLVADRIPEAARPW